MAAPLAYKVGGSLESDDAFYVECAADHDLYAHLLAGDPCFVFNSRQMGKSSLRVRTMRRLRERGVVSLVIDPQSRGTSPTEDQWYAGTIKRLIEDGGLAEAVPFSAWWKDNGVQALSAVNRLEEFIDKILLARVSAPIVIFVEEVDNLLSLNFDTDGFFTLIRALLERRAEQPDYRRLSFAFFGVATPYDLIRSENRSAFNIGHAVELGGFTLAEARPLLAGLRGRVADPEGVLAAVIHWSGGQPFLTQKLLALVSAAAVTKRARGSSAELVATLARERIIRNWEAQDSPVHLRTIRDRLLQGDERHRSRLLGLVQTIQEEGGIPANASHEQMQLRLTGLVVPNNGELRITNPIYGAVFSRDWVRDQLRELRPPIYAAAIRAWEGAPREQRPSHLISGAALEESLAWAKGKSLSDEDQEFLEASRAAESVAQLAEERARVAEREARGRRKVIVAMGVDLVALGGVSSFAWHQKRVSQWREQAAVVLSEATTAPVEALIRAITLRQRSQTFFVEDLAMVGTDPLALAMAATIGWGEVDRLEGHRGAVMALALSPDGQRILSGAADHTLRLWEAPEGLALAPSHSGHKTAVNDLAISADGRRVVAGLTDHSLRLWDLASGKLLGTFRGGHTKAVIAAAFSPDGRRLVSGSRDHTLRLWDVASRRPIGPPMVGHTGSIRSVTFRPDGRRIVSASEDTTLRLWEAATGRPSGQPLRGHTDWVKVVLYTPDGRRLVSGSSDTTLRLWDGASGRPIAPPLRGHDDVINAVAISPDGRRIVSGSGDSSLLLWDARTGQPQGRPLIGHAAAVRAVAFSRDGRRIHSASADNTLRIWQASTGQPIGAEVPVLQEEVNAMAFTPDGNHLLTVVGDLNLHLWEDTPFGTVRLACQRLRRHHLLLHPEAFRLDREFEAIARQAQQICRNVPPGARPGPGLPPRKAGFPWRPPLHRIG